MPTLRKREVIERGMTVALIGLTNVPCCPSFHEDDGSNVDFLKEHPSVHHNDPVSAIGIVKATVFEKEQFFGISVSSTYTNPSSDAPTDTDPSDEYQEHLSDIHPISSSATIGKRRVAMRNAK
jgi:hypothetical protein